MGAMFDSISAVGKASHVRSIIRGQPASRPCDPRVISALGARVPAKSRREALFVPGKAAPARREVA